MNNNKLNQNEEVTRYKITEYLKNLIIDQSMRGAPMLDYDGRIEEEVDYIISIAKKELISRSSKNESDVF